MTDPLPPVPSGEFLLYTTEDGRTRIQLRTKEHSAWLSQREMAELFDVSSDNVGLHLKNIYDDGELIREATAEESSVVQPEGSRQVQRKVTLYNLDAILAVGYRVRSPRGAQFRRWASTVLKEYLVKGFVLDDHRLKNPDGSGRLQLFPSPGGVPQRGGVVRCCPCGQDGTNGRSLIRMNPALKAYISNQVSTSRLWRVRTTPRARRTPPKEGNSTSSLQLFPSPGGVPRRGGVVRSSPGGAVLPAQRNPKR